MKQMAGVQQTLRWLIGSMMSPHGKRRSIFVKGKRREEPESSNGKGTATARSRRFHLGGAKAGKWNHQLHDGEGS